MQITFVIIHDPINTYLSLKQSRIFVSHDPKRRIIKGLNPCPQVKKKNSLLLPWNASKIKLQSRCSLQPNAIAYKECIDKMFMTNTGCSAAVELVNGVLDAETPSLDQVADDQKPGAVVAVVTVDADQRAWERGVLAFLHFGVDFALQTVD